MLFCILKEFLTEMLIIHKRMYIVFEITLVIRGEVRMDGFELLNLQVDPI